MISPGTAKTSRPSSSARSAVISAPLRSLASTTTVACARPATIRLRAGKRHGAGSTPGGYSETTRPARADPAGELRMRRRIVAVDAAAENGDRGAAGFERAAMRLAVDAARHPADDDEPRGGQLAAERARDVRAVRRAGSGADDRDRRPVQQLDRARRRAGRGRAAGRRSSGARRGRRGPSARASGRRGRPAARGRRARRSCRGSAGTARPSAPRRRGRRSRRRRRRAPARSWLQLLWASGTRAPRRRAPAGRRRSLRARRRSAPRGRPGRGRGPRAAAARPRVASSSSASSVRLG